MVLVDTNVLLDVLTEDETWHDWSAGQLLNAADQGVAINPIIYAELAVYYERIEDLRAMAENADLTLLTLPYDAGYMAGRAFGQYKKNRGGKTAPLADFYIGAHALLEGFPLLTRDPGMYRTYFPKLRIISP